MAVQTKGGKQGKVVSAYDSKVASFVSVDAKAEKGIVFVTEAGHTFRTSKKALRFYAKAWKAYKEEIGTKKA